MKILHLVPIISDAATYGGPARGTLRQAVESVGRGHEVTVMAMSPDVKSVSLRSISGVPVVLSPMFRIPGHRIAGSMSVRGLKWLVRHARDFDVVHVHAGREVFAAAAMLILRAKGVPYILQTHGMLAPRSSIVHRLYDSALTRPAIRGVAKVLSLTDYEQRDLRSFFENERIERVVNGVDDPVDAPLETGNDVMEVVYLSRIHPRKKVVDLLEAVAAVNRDSIRARLTYYGPDEGALAGLIARVRELDAEGYVTYRGPIPYSEVRSTLRQFDVFVLPSVNEPFPNSVLEAMANGMAVICTTSCGLAPYIRRTGAGIVVEPGASNIEEALDELILDPTRRRQLGTAALNLTRQEFSMEAVVDSLIEVYQNAMATPAASNHLR